jgi:hypothetical protein
MESVDNRNINSIVAFYSSLQGKDDSRETSWCMYSDNDRECIVKTSDPP